MGGQIIVILVEPEQGTPLRTAKMIPEDDYGMIRGINNNCKKKRGGGIERAKKDVGKKLSVGKRKKECSEHKPSKSKSLAMTPRSMEIYGQE